MRSRVPLLVVVLLMAPALLPPATADHAPEPDLQRLMDAWVATGASTLAAAPVHSLDAGVATTLRADLFLKLNQSRPLELGLSTARALYFADYANLSADAPKWNNTNASTRHASGNAHRLYFLNATDDLKVEADAEVAAARAAYAAFSPRTGPGAEVAIMGAWLLMGAQDILESGYNESRQKLAVDYVNPDVTTGVYRSAVQTLVFQTSGMAHLARLSVDVLDLAKTVDAAGGPLLRPGPWGDLVADRTARVQNPSATAPGPEQPRLAVRAAGAFADEAPILGIAGYVHYESARQKGADQFRLNQGTTDRVRILNDLADRLDEAEIALNETSVNGLTGAILQDAAADARVALDTTLGTDALLSTAAKIEVALVLHQDFVRAVGAGKDDGGLPPIAVIGAGLLLVAGIGLVLVRRRGGGDS